MLFRSVIITVLSLDKVNPPDTLAVLAASTALSMCNFLPKTNYIPTTQVEESQEEKIGIIDIYINFDTEKQSYSFQKSVKEIHQNTAIKLGNPIALSKSILNGACNYQAYLLIDDQEGDLIQIPEEYLNSDNHPGLKESLKRAVSKAVQLGQDGVNSPAIFNSQFTPKNYTDYQLYRGPVASIRIGYKNKKTDIDEKSLLEIGRAHV